MECSRGTQLVRHSKAQEPIAHKWQVVRHSKTQERSGRKLLQLPPVRQKARTLAPTAAERAAYDAARAAAAEEVALLRVNIAASSFLGRQIGT